MTMVPLKLNAEIFEFFPKSFRVVGRGWGIFYKLNQRSDLIFPEFF